MPGVDDDAVDATQLVRKFIERGQHVIVVVHVELCEIDADVGMGA